MFCVQPLSFSVYDQRKQLTFTAQVLYEQASIYKRVIQAEKDARRLWFALQGWQIEDPEIYFGDLGAWAERKENFALRIEEDKPPPSMKSRFLLFAWRN